MVHSVVGSLSFELYPATFWPIERGGIMPFDGLLLFSTVQELQCLVNSRVQRIRQCQPSEVVLTLRQPGYNYDLLLSADPTAARIHLTQQDNTSPLTPFNFGMLLRKHLEPARLLSIEQRGWERIVIIRFEARNEDGQRVERHLILEIMGRHSNLLLVDPQTNCILDGIRHVSAQQSRHREVLPGRPYILPPSQGKEDPALINREKFMFHLRHTPAPQEIARSLAQHYDAISLEGAREIIFGAGLSANVTKQELSETDAAKLWSSFSQLMHQLANGDIEPWGAANTDELPVSFWIFPLTHLALEGGKFAEVNHLLDWYYSARQKHAALSNLQQRLRRVLSHNIERCQRRLEHQDIALKQAARADEFRLKGELLLAHWQTVPAGAKSVQLENYYEPSQMVLVELNPALNAKANADRYFRRYQKAKKTVDQARIQQTAASTELAYLEGVLQAVNMATDIADLEEIHQEMQVQGLIRTSNANKKRSPEPIRTGHMCFSAPDGTQILVGKNNKQNDFITMSLARSNDIWLHVKDIPGSHVLIRAPQSLQPDTLALAAQLAAYYSKARSSSQVPVDYCLRKHVRKPRGARPGFVIYDHHKTIYTTPDPAILKSATRRDGQYRADNAYRQN